MNSYSHVEIGSVDFPMLLFACFLPKNLPARSVVKSRVVVLFDAFQRAKKNVIFLESEFFRVFGMLLLVHSKIHDMSSCCVYRRLLAANLRIEQSIPLFLSRNLGLLERENESLISIFGVQFCLQASCETRIFLHVSYFFYLEDVDDYYVFF